MAPGRSVSGMSEPFRLHPVSVMLDWYGRATLLLGHAVAAGTRAGLKAARRVASAPGESSPTFIAERIRAAKQPRHAR